MSELTSDTLCETLPDVAIEGNSHPGNFKTGIIIDNPTYFDTPTVRNREIGNS